MRRIKQIISESILFVCGMIAGRLVFGGMRLWITMLIGMTAFTILWMVWDGITETKRNQNRHGKKEREENAA